VVTVAWLDPLKNKFMNKGVTSAIGKPKHRPGYRAPRVGEPRRHRMPLRLDKCSPEVKAVIVESRASGMTWLKTAEAASAKAGQRLSPTTVQRWYDLRIEQPQSEVSSIVPLLREIIDLLKSRLPAVKE
jgi:hypothetical protein